MIDRHDLTGKIPPPEVHYSTVVVGAGEAGIAAALAATGSVLLIDENPVRPGLMGTDVPLFYGGRMTAATQNPARMVEQLLAASPGLGAAFEAGIDVRLGTVAWGLYRNGPAMQTLPGPMLGLADAERAWMVGFDRLVLATGACDVVLGFPDWERPGVVGAQGLHALLTRYAAFAGRRVLILGTGGLALATARLCAAHGIEVAGLVEVLDAPLGPTGDFPVHLGRTIAATAGGIDGVTGVTLDDGTAIECDTICLALGVQPATELLDAAGGSAELAGDCAGPEPDAAYVAAWARALGRHAASDTIVCQCEEVTRVDLLGVQPPRYLAHPLPPRALASVAHPDQVKRLTRAGMGPCQGRRCRTQVACLLAEATGGPVPVASLRAPVRPIPLRILADWEERADMAAGWDVWFGIPTQWTPYAAIGTEREAELVADGGNMHV